MVILSLAVGCSFAILYIFIIFFNVKEGEPPHLSFTVGPIHNGMLYFYKVHVHHWVIYLCLSIIFGVLAFFVEIFIGFFAFSFIMTLHGLTYKDRCSFE